MGMRTAREDHEWLDGAAMLNLCPGTNFEDYDWSSVVPS